MRIAIYIAAALGIIGASAAPANSETWVMYDEEEASSINHNIRKTYSIDAASIAKHNGWIYVNHKKCMTSHKHLANSCTISSIGAQCIQYKLRSDYPILAEYSKRNNDGHDEWWTDTQIRDKSRFKFITNKETLRQVELNRARVDMRYSTLFRYLCN